MKKSLPKASDQDYESQLDFDLLVSQRNELYQIVHEGGFGRGDFEWVATDGGFFGSEDTTVPMLRHVETGFFFTVGFQEQAQFERIPFYNQSVYFEGEFFVQRSPAEASIRDTLLWISWKSVLAAFRDWLAFVKRESTEPDFWNVQPPADFLPALQLSASNEPFSAEERRLIGASLDEIKAEITRVAELTVSQKESFDATIQVIRESSERLGRKDWANALLGAFVGWAATNTLGSQAAQSLFNFIATKLSWVWAELPKLTP